MLRYAKGNVLECNATAIVNAVNCRGVMGAGLARVFAVAHEDMYKDYQKICKNGELQLGKLHTWKNVRPKPERASWIVNFPTMDYPGEQAKRYNIANGLDALAEFVRDQKIASLGIPALGCGIGRFPWEEFKEMIENWANDLPELEVIVYEPH